MEPSIEVGSNLVYFGTASINLARNCAGFSSSLWIISQSLSKLTDLCPGFWRSTMWQTTVWLWAAHQVSLPDNPSWDLLRNSRGPMDLVLSVHQHAPERLATLVPSLLGEKWRKAWYKYHTRLSLKNGFSSVQFSRSVLSDSLRPHESQQARPPCPSPTPGVYSNSCPSSRWCHPAISSSVVPFSSCPNPSQHQGLFKQVNSSHEVPKVLEFQLQHPLGVPMNTQDRSLLGWTGWISLKSKGLRLDKILKFF